MIVVSYYTDKKYKQYSDRLQESARLLGLHCAVYAERNTGSWEGNVYRKPHVVRKAMDAYPMESIFFVDADARFVSFPKELIAPNWDVACYFEGPNQPVSAAVYLLNSERSREFVDEWARGCDRGEHLNEDFHWMNAAFKKFPSMRVGHLPPSYFWQEATMRCRFPTAVPVLEHFNIGEHTFG